MLLCFLQAHGSHNITPKLCLHMVPVINDGDLRTIFLEAEALKEYTKETNNPELQKMAREKSHSGGRPSLTVSIGISLIRYKASFLHGSFPWPSSGALVAVQDDLAVIVIEIEVQVAERLFVRSAGYGRHRVGTYCQPNRNAAGMRACRPVFGDAAHKGRGKTYRQDI